MLMNLSTPVRAAMQNPDSVAFTLFGYSVYWYGVLMALGILAAFVFAYVECKRKRMHPDTPFDLCLVAIPCGVVGARLYYVAFNSASYLANPVSILYLWEGGLAIYGAVIGAAIGLFIYARRKKIRFLRLADVCAPGLVLAQSIGRWGNFFNQEAYGPLVENPAHMWFPFAVLIDSTKEIHYATFFYESLWCLLVFLFLWLFLRKRTKHDGDVFLWYVLLYAFERMLIEGLRTDSLYLGGIRISQLLSACLFAAVLVFLIVRAVRERKAGRIMWPSPETEAPAAPEPTDEAEQPEAPESSDAVPAGNDSAAEVPAEDANDPECTQSTDTEENPHA